MKKLFLLPIILGMVLVTYSQTAFYNGKQDTKNDQQNLGFTCAGIDPFTLDCAFWVKTVYYFWGGDEANHQAIMTALSQGQNLQQILGTRCMRSPLQITLPFQEGPYSYGTVNAVLIVYDESCLNPQEYMTILSKANTKYSIESYMPCQN